MHTGFSGLRAFVARKKSWCKLIINLFVIPHTVPSTVKYEPILDSLGWSKVVDVYDVVFHYPKISEKELLKMNNLSRIRAYYVHREFYCSDLNTGFVGTIKGLNGEGLLCNENFEFSVIKAKPSDQEN